MTQDELEKYSTDVTCGRQRSALEIQCAFWGFVPNVNILQASSLLSVKMGTLISLSSEERDEGLCTQKTRLYSCILIATLSRSCWLTKRRGWMRAGWFEHFCLVESGINFTMLEFMSPWGHLPCPHHHYKGQGRSFRLIPNPSFCIERIILMDIYNSWLVPPTPTLFHLAHCLQVQSPKR